jgi:hypothetical protein
MAKATPTSLTDKERALLNETERAHLKTLDEDAIAALHVRVIRARSKFVTNYRREASAQVIERGARGKVSSAPRRSAGKAEIFEEALARVSTALAAAARQSAAELKAERLAAAAGTPAEAPPGGRAPTTGGRGQTADRSRGRTAAERKSAASSKATGARRQAKRDSR